MAVAVAREAQAGVRVVDGLAALAVGRHDRLNVALEHHPLLHELLYLRGVLDLVASRGHVCVLLPDVAQHPLLEEFYEHIKYKLYRYRSYLNYDPPAGYFDVVGAEHVRICDILKLRDQGMAEAIMRRHLALARAEFKRKFPIKDNQEFNRKIPFTTK